MIPDLKYKFPFLFTLAPTIFWATLLVDFNPVILAITLIGAVLSGIHLAIIESVESLPHNENTENRLNELFRGNIVTKYFRILWIYPIISYLDLGYFVCISFDNLTDYQWLMIIVVIILAVSYGVGMLISKEKRDGFTYAANLGEESNEKI